MSELTLTLKGEAAARLERLAAVYPSAEAAVADALEALEENLSPALDAWLHNVVGPRLDAMRADPASSLSAEQVRKRLFDKA
jgi:hypothetical protein